MANLTGTPTYVNVLRQLEIRDPAHPNTWNPNYQVLINNDVFLKELVDAVSQTLVDHISMKGNVHELTADEIGAALKSHTHSANDLPSASTTGKGLVQLSTSTTSVSTSLAATSSAVNTIRNLVNGKADKAQEAWIKPVLLNGWKSLDLVETRFYKDGFGIVHVEGAVVDGTGDVVFTLPAGYRPGGWTLGGDRISAPSTGVDLDDYTLSVRPLNIVIDKNGRFLVPKMGSGIYPPTLVFNFSFRAE